MVEVRGLTKRYGSFTAIGGVSLDVEAGECFALLGPNGSGKTTTLKCLAGLAIPTAGNVSIHGIDLVQNSRAAKAVFSYLPQRVAFPENLTAAEILAFYCRLRGATSERATAVLDQLGLGGVRDKPVGEFSGGMIQRLGIVVALLPDAPLLLLDEPGAGLDPESAVRLRETLRSLSRAGKTIVFSSHALADVELLADRAAVLVSGRIVAVASVGQFESSFGAAARLHVRLRNPEPRFSDAALQAGAAQALLIRDILTVSCPPHIRLPVLEALERAGAGIERFFTGEPSLEEIYLRYVNESASFPSDNHPGGVRDPSATGG